MTGRELIKEILESDFLDAEVRINYDGGWTSLQAISIPKRSGQDFELEPADTLYDTQTVEEKEPS